MNDDDNLDEVDEVEQHPFDRLEHPAVKEAQDDPVRVPVVNLKVEGSNPGRFARLFGDGILHLFIQPLKLRTSLASFIFQEHYSRPHFYGLRFTSLYSQACQRTLYSLALSNSIHSHVSSLLIAMYFN